MSQNQALPETVGRLLIIGPGLMGGSLAAALKQAGSAIHICGYGRSEDKLRQGLEMGLLDEISTDLDAALRDVDVVLIATPTRVAASLLRQLLEQLDSTALPIITDVASVKGNLRDAAIAACGSVPPKVVLAHPIAGSEQSGIQASNPTLFQNHRVILTPEPDTCPVALATVRSLWQSAGAEVVELGVEEHDQVLAATSHLPHMLAYALVDSLTRSEHAEDIFRFAAGGFRDFSRIASSDPVMWRDIALANRSAVLDAVDAFSERLGSLRAAVEQGDADALLETFSRAKQARDTFTAELAQRQRRS